MSSAGTGICRPTLVLVKLERTGVQGIKSFLGFLLELFHGIKFDLKLLSFAFVIVNLGSILEVGFLDDVEFGAGWVIPN